MIIDKKKIKNPYLLAYLKAFNINDGEEIKNYDFMFWIDKKHTEYRNIHNMPEHIMLNDEQVKDFCVFIGCNSFRIWSAACPVQFRYADFKYKKSYELNLQFAGFFIVLPNHNQTNRRIMAFA